MDPKPDFTLTHNTKQCLWPAGDTSMPNKGNNPGAFWKNGMVERIVLESY